MVQIIFLLLNVIIGQFAIKLKLMTQNGFCLTQICHVYKIVRRIQYNVIF